MCALAKRKRIKRAWARIKPCAGVWWLCAQNILLFPNKIFWNKWMACGYLL